MLYLPIPLADLALNTGSFKSAFFVIGMTERKNRCFNDKRDGIEQVRCLENVCLWCRKAHISDLLLDLSSLFF